MLYILLWIPYLMYEGTKGNEPVLFLLRPFFWETLFCADPFNIYNFSVTCLHENYLSLQCYNLEFLLLWYILLTLALLIIIQIEIYAQLALRIVLHGAYELSLAKLDDKKQMISGHTCSSIATQMKSTCTSVKPSSTAKHQKKQSASTRSTVMGLNPVDNVYYGKYWSLFCLQSHVSDHPKTVVTKCQEIAQFLATVVEQCIPVLTLPPSKAKQFVNIESMLNHVFSCLALPPIQENSEQTFSIEDFRKNVKSISIKMRKLVPKKSTKQQPHAISSGKLSC